MTCMKDGWGMAYRQGLLPSLVDGGLRAPACYAGLASRGCRAKRAHV